MERDTASIDARASFDFIRYGSVWEDADVLCEALAPRARGGRFLSIASAGDNVLALLTLDPAAIVAVDLNPAQLACLELRIAAFRRFDRPRLLAFLGIAGSEARATDYRDLRSELTERTRAFWDARPREIEQGIAHAGKFERYFALFRERILPLVHSRATIAELRRPKSIDEQRSFYERRWNTWRWRLLFKLFFGRAVMGRLGRDPEFFAEVEGRVGPRILERTRWALTEQPVATNPFFTYIVTGNFAGGALPRYLRAEHFDAIRARLDRIRVVAGRLEDGPGGPFDGFNLSDIFEYMSRAEHERCYAAVLDRAGPSARIVYWNLLVPRGRPEAEARRARPLDAVAAELHARDRAWFYQRLHVDEVTAGPTP